MANSGIQVEQDGTYQQQPVMRCRIQNKTGMCAEVYNMGGIISKLMVPDKNQQLRNVVFGFDDFQNYLPNLDHHIGSIVGRYANRIGGAAFRIDGHRYVLAANEGNNILHGGKDNLSRRFWDMEVLGNNSLTLSIVSPDGDQGFPGTLKVKVTLTVSDDQELILQYAATSSKSTHVCFTQHGYFNLKGSPSSVLEHSVWVNADALTETDQQQIPTGKYVPVSGSVYDLRQPVQIKNIIKNIPEGLDNNFVLNNYSVGKYAIQKAAALSDPDSGILMELFTSEPGLQLYTANHLHKIESPFPIPHFPAICLEAQHFPDSPNKPNFPSTLLLPGETYSQETRYRFSLNSL